MCGCSILSYARVICMHDGLWYGITVQLKQTISTYYGAINSTNMEQTKLKRTAYYSLSNHWE
jgi:hypothetical protein